MYEIIVIQEDFYKDLVKKSFVEKRAEWNVNLDWEERLRFTKNLTRLFFSVRKHQTVCSFVQAFSWTKLFIFDVVNQWSFE